MKNSKMIIVFALLILSTFFATSVFAQGGNYGLDATANAAQLPQNGDLASVLGNIIGTALSMISVLFFGLILYGGITWMLARGKSENTQKALDTIIAAIIGLVVILAAYAITNFVFDNVKSGVSNNTVNNVNTTNSNGNVASEYTNENSSTVVEGCYCEYENGEVLANKKLFSYSLDQCVGREDAQSIEGGSGCEYLN